MLATVTYSYSRDIPEAGVVEDEKLGLAEGVDKLENKPELQPEAEDVEKKNEPEEEEDKV